MIWLLAFLNGEQGVISFKCLTERLNYLFDNISLEKLMVKIDKFDLNTETNRIFVRYRIGRQKGIQKKYIFEFSKKYYEKISSYDKQRLAKFTTLEILLREVFTNTDYPKLIEYIIKETENEQLF